MDDAGLRFFTSLDPPETNARSPNAARFSGVVDSVDLAPDPLQNYEPAITFRHSGWKHDRQRVYESLRRTKQSSNRLNDFAQCGKHAYVYQNVDSPDQYRIGGSTCHDRFCLPCARERSRVIATNVLDKLEFSHARFLTLTLRSDTESLDHLLAKLSKDFATLRRSKLWRNKVTGGVAFIEIKWIAVTSRWHPHLHCLLQGRYIPQSELAKTWQRITHTSKIVDIRFAKDNAHLTHYITKYASKPLDHTVTMQPERLDEAVLALKGKRLCLTFGTWRGYALTEPLDAGQWTQIGSLTEILKRAEDGNQRDQQILIALDVPWTEPARASPAPHQKVFPTLTYGQLKLQINQLTFE